MWELCYNKIRIQWKKEEVYNMFTWSDKEDDELYKNGITIMCIKY